MMLDSLHGFLIEIIESEGIRVGFEFPQEAATELDPFGLAHLAFEDGFLHPDAI